MEGYKLKVDNEFFATVYVESAELENFREMLSLVGFSVNKHDIPMLETHGGWFFENTKYHFELIGE